MIKSTKKNSKSFMIKQLLLSLAGAVAIWAQGANSITVGDYDYGVDTLLHVTTGPGIQTTGVRLTRGTVQTNIFYTAIDMRNPNLELRGVQALDKERASENILNMGNRKNRQGKLQYIAGVNGDHANLSGTEKRTNGIAFIDNLLYNHGVGDSNWQQFCSYVTVEGHKDVNITEAVDVRLSLKFPRGTSYKFHINSGRHENYLVIYTPEHGSSTKTNTWGRECQMKLVSGSIPEGNAVFEVTSQGVGDCTGNPAHGNMAIPADGFVLSGVGAAFSLVGQLNVGDRVEMEPLIFTVDGLRANDISSVIGGCPIIVDNGEAISTSECQRLNTTTAIQITATARTAIGYDRERTKMYLVVTDSYKTNKNSSGDKASYGATSSGLDFRTLAQFMIYLGCNTAMAMDGGGSSQLYNIGLGICNIPYGEASYLRPVANGFFAANNTPADNGTAYIEVRQKNVRLNSGESFTPKVYGYNKYGVLIDTDIKDFSLTVNSSLGQVTGTTFKAGAAKKSSIGIVDYHGVKCGVRISTNGGGEYVSSGEEVATELIPPYLADNPAGIEDVSVSAESDAPAVYYNLQGQAVASPRAGIYITRQGSSARKVYILQ